MSTSPPPITLRLGGYQKPASIHNRAAGCFGEQLGSRLGDRLRFELVGNVLELGRGSADLPRMVASGELEACYISSVHFTGPVPEFGALELPFVVRDRPTVHQAFEGEYGALLEAGMHASTDMRLLGLWDNGFRHLSNRVRPIRTPADCQGLKIRTQLSALHGELFSALGFIPVPVDVKEYVEQAAGPRFDAQENPLTNTFNFSVHKLHRYMTLTGHLFGGTVFICNARAFDRWPAEVQQAVLESAREATLHQRALAAAEDDTILGRLDPAENEIIVPTVDERQAFIDAAGPVIARHRVGFDPKVLSWLAAG